VSVTRSCSNHTVAESSWRMRVGSPPQSS
jgi:hypothetical protein